jgi:hypothetical protein
MPRQPRRRRMRRVCTGTFEQTVRGEDRGACAQAHCEHTARGGVPVDSLRPYPLVQRLQLIVRHVHARRCLKTSGGSHLLGFPSSCPLPSTTTTAISELSESFQHARARVATRDALRRYAGGYTPMSAIRGGGAGSATNDDDGALCALSDHREQFKRSHITSPRER